MTDILTVLMFRHTVVFNPEKRCYGRDDIAYNLTAEPVVARVHHLSKILPTDPADTLWLSSDYPRARDTGREILKAVGHDNVPQIIIDPRFIEQQYGKMTGMKRVDIRKDTQFMPFLTDPLKNAPPEGESLQMLESRIGNGLDDVVATAPPHIKNIVVSTHGGAMMAGLAHVTRQPIIDIFNSRGKGETPAFSYMSLLKFSYNKAAGQWMNAVEYDEGLPKLDLTGFPSFMNP